MSEPSTEHLYDHHAERWARRAPTLLSDFTARPRVVAALGDLHGRRVLDLGCGEGYVARSLLDAGAAFVEGYDLSAQMIARANAAIPTEASARLQFAVRDLASGLPAPERPFDDCIAVFLFNYLSRAQTASVLSTVRQQVRSGGRFLFTVPHPALAWMRPHEAPFYFDGRDATYQGAVDQTLQGEIWRRDGDGVPVRAVHKTFTDYNRLLRDGGFVALPTLEELYVTPEHLALDPDFFGPLEGVPLHVLYTVTVP